MLSLWHQWLDHLNYDNCRLLSSIVDEIIITDSKSTQDCEVYTLMKQHKQLNCQFTVFTPVLKKENQIHTDLDDRDNTLS